MQLGMIGLGRMGNGMTERLREHDHDVKTYDPNVESRTASSLEELKSQLDAPRAVETQELDLLAGSFCAASGRAPR